MSFINNLIATLSNNRNTEDAFHMQKYMKGKYVFYGIKTKERRKLLKEVAANHTAEIQNEIRNIALQLYEFPQRELHYCAMELFEKQLRKKYIVDDITIIETLLTTNSWWDTVDFISKQILGKYLQQYPEQIDHVIMKFSSSDNLWLNRSTLIFQLSYKDNTNEELLFKQCEYFKDSNEFFIKKAIGWALREYAKTNPQSVLNFVNSTSLKPLSRKEAIRNII